MSGVGDRPLRSEAVHAEIPLHGDDRPLDGRQQRQAERDA